MNDVQQSSPATLASPELLATSLRHAPTALHTCLIVSTSPRRAQLLVRGAHEEHWATLLCTNADDALRQTLLHRVHLALVDLQSAAIEQESRLRALVERLAERGGPLLAVCGRAEDAMGEVWSRQLGVWMYLPGVDSQSDIALLCSEAKLILEKLKDRASQLV